MLALVTLLFLLLALQLCYEGVPQAAPISVGPPDPFPELYRLLGAADASIWSDPEQRAVSGRPTLRGGGMAPGPPMGPS